ncbi:hypothetical protein D3C87_2144350 [compost metagenome]
MAHRPLASQTKAGLALCGGYGSGDPDDDDFRAFRRRRPRAGTRNARAEDLGYQGISVDECGGTVPRDGYRCVESS